MKSPVERIAEAIENHRAVLVIGTGLSIMASGNSLCASWTGLLQHGIAHCERQNWWTAKEVAACQALIEIDRRPLAAQMIRDSIYKRGEHAYQSWLRDALTKLPGADHAVLQAVHDLNAKLITLNYDRLLEASSATALEPITWKDEYHLLEFLHGREQEKVLHLHGYFDRADTVILDIASYARLLNNRVVEAFRNALSLTWTVVYIGCGGTFDDPHFAEFRKWVSDVCKGGTQPHFRLVHEAELDDARQIHRNDGIVPVSYGADYADLLPFLQKLRPSQAVGASLTESVTAVRPYLTAKPLLRGRDKELAGLVNAILSDAPRPVCIGGPPGFGKSALALSALHDSRVEARFGPRRYFVRVDAAKTVSDMANTIARAMDLVPSTSASPENVVFDSLSASPAVLAVDNLETVWEPESQRRSVEEWLGRISGIPGSVLIATMRGNELPGNLGWQTPCGLLAPLDAESSRRVFIDIACAFENDPGLSELLEQLGGWPLAIVLMAHQSRGQLSLDAVLRRWNAERSRMLTMGVGIDATTSVRVSLQVSIDSPRMTQSALHLLKMLAHLPAGLADVDLKRIGSSHTDAQRVHEMGLTFAAPGRVRLLPFVKEYVAATHRVSAKDARRLNGLYLDLCKSEGSKMGTSRGALGVSRLSPEVPNVEFVLASVSTDKRLVPALTGWAKFVHYTGHGNAAVLQDRLLEVARLSSPPESAELIYAAAQLARSRSGHDSARDLYAQALSLYQQNGATQGEANCIRSLGDLSAQSGEHRTARQLYQQALDLYVSIEDQSGEASCIQSLGDIALRQSDFDSARAFFERARPLYESAGTVLGAANCIKSLGDIARYRDNNEGARQLYEQARALYHSIGNVLGEANCIGASGDIDFSLGDLDTAQTQYEQVRPLYRRIGSVIGEANSIVNLANVALSRDDTALAQSLYEQARPLYQRIVSLSGEARSIYGLGSIALETDDYEMAHALFEQAMALYRQAQAPLGEANCLRKFAQVAYRQGQDEAARSFNEQALVIFERVGTPLSIGSTFRALALTSGPEERCNFIRKANAAWLGIARMDLTSELLEDFPECFAREEH